jgi:glycosyltransferase involved in cell wall biosynthesis
MCLPSWSSAESARQRAGNKDLVDGRTVRQGTHNAQRGHDEGLHMRPRRLFAAVRDLDPPGGGAERSLAALLNGVSKAGPTLETAPRFVPMTDAPDAPTHPAWSVSAFASSDRGERIGLLRPEVDLTTTELPIEGFWSKIAWSLRERKGEQRRRKWAHDRHLGRRGPQFAAHVGTWLDSQNHDGAIGLTQLEWSCGAAKAFADRGIPYIMFVRDDTVFRLEKRFRPVMEGAALVCAAGEGLLADIRARFAIQRGHSVPLPIDFGGRFGSMEDVKALRASEQAKRTADAPPTIGIMVVTPEKGLRMYQQILPKMRERWPEAEVHIAGGSAYPQQLAHHPNARVLGHVDAATFFASIDVHLILFETTGSWGRVIGEAGLFGVPSVTSDVGSQKEALGEGGILVDDGHDADAVIDALRTVYEHRERYGTLAREHTRMVDHRRSVAAFRTGLEELLNDE